MTLLAIPDIHGQKAELDRVLRLADARCGTGARIVFLGDLVDRGPDSRGGVQTLIDGIDGGRDWIVLRGNHDQMFVEFLDAAAHGAPGLRRGAGWLGGNLGGVETLLSYGADIPADGVGWRAVADSIPDAHKAFLAGLPVCHETGEHFLVHAGIRPGVPLSRQDPEDMIWIREPFLSDRRDHGKLVIHGHTPVEEATHCGNRVNLDGGAGWGRPLNVFRLDGQRVTRLTPEGETPIRQP